MFSCAFQAVRVCSVPIGISVKKILILFQKDLKF